jgi:hypothetical protein
MFANKYTLNLKDFTGTTDQQIILPIDMDFQIVDNAELIERVFVETEVENAINNILDYDRVRFMPLTQNNKAANKITYDLTFDSNINTYSGIGFEYDDLKFRKNSFTNSHLKLLIFDSDDPMVQNLVGYSTLFCRLTRNDLLSGTTGTYLGLPKPLTQIGVNFIVENPILNKRGFSEGYHIYFYKDSLNIGETKYLYIRGVFNNAKTGKSINLMVKNTPQNVQSLVHELYTRVIITRTQTGYYYKFDETYQGNSNIIGVNNITNIGNDISIKLYQVLAI